MSLHAVVADPITLTLIGTALWIVRKPLVALIQVSPDLLSKWLDHKRHRDHLELCKDNPEAATRLARLAPYERAVHGGAAEEVNDQAHTVVPQARAPDER